MNRGDGQHRWGAPGSDLVWRWTGGGGDLGESTEECVEGGVAIVNGAAFFVGEPDLSAHAVQVVLGFEQLCFGRAFWSVEITTSACHPVRALLEEAVCAPAVAKVVVLPRFACGCSTGGHGVAVNEDLDSADVSGEVSGLGVGLGQGIRGDLGVVLGGVRRTVPSQACSSNSVIGSLAL